jgi:hypothetical protein
MEKRRFLLPSLATATLLMGSVVNPQLASAQRDEQIPRLMGPSVNSPLASGLTDEQTQKQLHDNNDLFEQLSGAARTLLELKFGKKSTTSTTSSEPTTAPNSPIEEESNVLVNNRNLDLTAQDTQSETSLVVFGPGGNGNTTCSGYNDSGSFIGGAQKFTGFSRSGDGGATWADQGALPNNADGDAGDPVLAHSSRTGTIFFSTLQFTGSGIRVFRSTDGCNTFLSPVQGAPGKSGFQDKEWIAVDNFLGSGQGNVYLVERDFGIGNGIYFFRSTDDGSTFFPSGGTLIASGAANNVQGAYVTVGRDHAVYVFFFDQSTPQRIRMRRSSDQGLTFDPAVTVATLATTGTNGNLGLGGGFRTNAFPQAAVNPVNNDIYVVFNDKPAGADKADIFFTRSVDSGAAWTDPVRVNDDSGTNDQWQPTLAVMPDGKHVFISFYDRRLDAGNSLIDVFGVIGDISTQFFERSSNRTLTFEPNFRITDASFPVVIGQDPVINSVYMGDYDQAVTDDNFIYVTWGDNRLANPNFPAHTHQPDVRFQKYLIFAGISGDPNCHGTSVSTLARQFGGLMEAAQALGFSSVSDLQNAILTFCGS